MAKGKVIRSMSTTAMRQGGKPAPQPPRTAYPLRGPTPRRGPAPDRGGRSRGDGRDREI